MIKFLIQKNLWTIDLITSMSFGLILGYLVLSESVENKYIKTNWAAIFSGTLSYIVALILGVSLQKKFSWMRSWAWMGIVGVLLQDIFLLLIHFPKMWDHQQSISPTISEARTGFIYEVLSSTATGWLAWGIISLTFIFTIRFFAYILLTVYSFYNCRKMS